MSTTTIQASAATVAVASDGSPKLFEATLRWPLELQVFASTYVVSSMLLIVLAIIAWQVYKYFSFYQSFQVDQAELGLAGSKIKLTPNEVDRQIAYKIWVELSTRKIGLQIDLDHDVIAEVYDSWHTFFQVTRELIKDVPVNKFRRRDTEEIIRISIGVLNDGLRPHLTTWQARFRRWYEHELKSDYSAKLAPQEIQRKFPEYEGLSEDLLKVNSRLIAYRKLMHDLVAGKKQKSAK